MTALNAVCDPGQEPILEKNHCEVCHWNNQEWNMNYRLDKSTALMLTFPVLITVLYSCKILC